MVKHAYTCHSKEVSHDNEGGRTPSDPAYNLVTKAFHGLVKDRNKFR